MSIVVSLSRLILAAGRTLAQHSGVRQHLTCEMNARLRLLLGGGILVALAACGPQPGHAALRSQPARPTLASADPSPSPASPSPDASAQPVTPEPALPLVVVRSPNGMIAAATADGTFMWSFDPRVLGIANAELVTGGPNLLAYGEGKVAVIDRNGTIIGRGVLTTQPGPGNSELLPEPTGTRWAWTTVDTKPSDGASSPAPQVSSLWVAGLGQPPRKVKAWTGDYVVSGRQWSDAGVVIVKLTSTCGGDPHSSALVDPATGAETELFGAGRWPLDVGSGLHVAMDVDSRSLYVEGAAQITKTYPLTIHKARVDPSGSRVFVSTFDMSGCGGEPKAATSILSVPSGTQTTIDGFFADAWLDDTRVLGRSVATRSAGGFNWSAHVQVADLSGRMSDVALGMVVGVLRP